MKMTFLGTGGAFEDWNTNYHNNVLLEIDSKKILIDCSLTAIQALKERDTDLLDIDGVIVTHIHGDHVSGLEELGFQGMFLGQGQKFDLWTMPQVLTSKVNPDYEGPCLWENTLKGGMMHIQDEEGNPREADMHDYFNYRTSPEFEIGDNQFRFVPTRHVPNKASFGLEILTDGNQNVLFTADARPMPEHMYTGRDYIFHDCIFHPYYEATVHTHLEELEGMPEEQQKRTWIMHYGDPDAFETDSELNIAEKGQTFEL
jgi:ribonuclease BN (tRNA processing enzyme)